MPIDPSTKRGERTIVGTHSSRLSPPDLLALIRESLEDDKAVDIIVVDLAGKTSIADFMVIASGQSTRQVGAMTDHLAEKLKAKGVRGVTIEGQPSNDWVLLDAGDVIVHLFRPEVREFYKLEKLWSQPPPEIDGAAVHTA